MIEEEHAEICQVDLEEKIFLEKCRKLLTEAGFHPINSDPLPRAAPKKQTTYRLEYNYHTGEYTPVPIIQQHERGELR